MSEDLEGDECDKRNTYSQPNEGLSKETNPASMKIMMDMGPRERN